MPDAMSLGSAYADVTLNTSGFDRGLATSMTAMQGWNTQIARLATVALTVVGVKELLDFTRQSVRAFGDFQTAMVELAKVTDPDTAGSVGAAIRAMSLEMPIAQEAMMAIAADAGRMGIEGTQSILEFTEAVVKIGVATDVSAEEAATAFAKILKATGESTADMERLGSAINTMSNNMATSAAEIVDNMSRSANALAGLGMSTPDIVAMAAALNEVSESSMRAGTALRNIAERLMDPSVMEDLSEALAITMDQFRALRETDPVGLIGQLAGVLAEGGVAAENLYGILGESASRLAALGTNWASVETAVKAANEQYAQATSLQVEYNLAAETFQSRMQVLRNALTEIKVGVGEALVPVLQDVVTWLTANMDTIREFTTSVFQGLADAMRWIVDHWEAVKAGLVALTAAFAALVAVRVAAWAAAVYAALGPVGALLIAVGAGVVALRDALTGYAEKQREDIANARTLGESLAAGADAADTLQGAINLAGDQLSAFVATGDMSIITLSEIQEKLEGLRESVLALPTEQMAGAWQSGIRSILEEYGNVVPGLDTVLEQLVSSFGQAGADAAQGLAAGIVEESPAATEAALLLSQQVIGEIRDQFDSHSPSRVMQEYGRGVSVGLAQGIKAGEPEAVAAAEEVADEVKKSFGERLSGFLTTWGGEIRGAADLLGAGDLVGTGLNLATSLLSGDFHGFISAALDGIQWFADKAKEAAEEVKATFDEVVAGAWDLAQSFRGLISQSELYQKALAFTTDLLTQMFAGFLGPLSELFTEILSVFEVTEETTATAVQTISREIIGSLNVPYGWKALNRIRYAASNTGEPPIFGSGATSPTETLAEATEVVSDLILEFGTDIEFLKEDIKKVYERFESLWDILRPDVVGAALGVLDTGVAVLNGIVNSLMAIAPNISAFAAELGAVLSQLLLAAMPVINTFVAGIAVVADFFTKTVGPDLEAFFSGFGSWWRTEMDPFLQSKVFPKLEEVATFLWDEFTKLADFLGPLVMPLLKDLWAVLEGAWDTTLKPMIQDLADWVKTNWPLISSFLRNQLQAWLNELGAKLAQAGDYVRIQLLNGAGKTNEAIDAVMKSESLNFWQKLGTIWGLESATFWQKIGTSVSAIWQGIWGWVRGIFGGNSGGVSVPAYASGGYVSGPVGAPQLAVVHGGEYVVPNGGAGGGPIHIHVQVGSREIGEMVIADLKRSNALSFGAALNPIGG